MPWFMDTMPDGDAVRQVAQAYRGAHGSYTPYIQQTQTAHSATTQVWKGAGSDSHSKAVALTQQTANEHAGWLIALANVFDVLGTLLKIIFILQMAWLALQAATLLFGILTAGASVFETEGAAAAVEAAITALRQTVTTLLQSLARALMASLTRLIIGASAGGLSGLGVGIYTVETKHLSGWDAVLTLGGDTLNGATAGAVITTTPWALAGTAVGIGQFATNAALGGPTSFEQGSQQWAQQTFGGVPFFGGMFASAFTPSTDVQSAFDNLAQDTAAAGLLADMPKINSSVDEAGNAYGALKQRLADLRQQFNVGQNRVIANATYDINGETGDLTSASGQASRPGTVDPPTNRNFQTIATGNNPRTFDAEVKILEDIANKYAGDPQAAQGTVRLIVSKTPCVSCANVIRQFRQMFPNIKLIVLVVY